jgi:ABC-type antimicrobial peptide transport system permease subunit
MALGAAPTRMVAMVMNDSLKLIAAGFVIGIPFAFGVMRLLESSLYELGPVDPTSLAASAAVLITISLISALLPAYRAARTAPNAALRED